MCLEKKSNRRIEAPWQVKSSYTKRRKGVRDPEIEKTDV